ncbi:MAG: sensor histidine kinase [Vicinamibacterales bacterium]
MVLAIAAALCAAALVLYYQHRALSTLNAQTTLILRQIAEQTANDVVVEARRTLEGPVFDTLTAVNHPELRAGRLDLVAKEFADGLETYRHVERFFVWSTETESETSGEALFYQREIAAVSEGAGPTRPFTRDPPLGRAIVELARRHAPSQHIYVADEGVGPDRRGVFLRLFWTDARRVEFFAILGFVIEPSAIGRQLFAALNEGKVGALLKQRGREVPLNLRVIDENGALVYGSAATDAARATAATTLPMSFYPIDRIQSRLAYTIPIRQLTVEVSAPAGSSAFGVGGYWPTVVSAMLMLVALGLTVMANRRAAELARMQSDFVSHVSHQLKTPLSLLSAATETLAMDRARSPEKLAQYVGIIRNEATRLSALVQRILELSRLQQQRGYEFEEVDLSSLVRETVAAFEHGLSDQQFVFRVEEQVASLKTVADPAAIEQALVNLLDNAVKYSTTVKHIVVRVRSVSSSAIIEVIDRGIGLDKTDRARIFEKFYRGGGSALHRGGFGLGLPIALELVHAHGGRIEVESNLGQGATFRIILTLKAAEHYQPSESPAEPQRTEAMP